VPGDAASVILGDQASAASLVALREKLGLDQPVYVQYFAFLAKILTGDFGQSLSTGHSVIQEVLLILPSTIELTIAAIAIGLVFGLPLGIAAALSHNGWIDTVSANQARRVAMTMATARAVSRTKQNSAIDRTTTLFAQW
jgi:ABC-type dipeptide/oligopeptide/nickel transport system permease component